MNIQLENSRGVLFIKLYYTHTHTHTQRKDNHPSFMLLFGEVYYLLMFITDTEHLQFYSLLFPFSFSTCSNSSVLAPFPARVSSQRS